MKEKPILFSTPMVQAILDGRKTMTRRTKGLEEINHEPNSWQFLDCIMGSYKDKDPVIYRFIHKRTGRKLDIKCPYGQVGDILWVRETFINLQKTPVIGAGSEKFNGLKYWYKADNTKATEVVGRYKPSIHMPREACRIMLEITNIRVERLQDISEQDAITEGIERRDFNRSTYFAYKVYGRKNEYDENPKNSFWSLWESINGPESWSANPWVWVIEFKRIGK